MGVTFLAHPVGLHLKSIISRLPTLRPVDTRADSGGGILGRGQRAPPHQIGGLGRAVSSPRRDLGAPPENLDFGAFWDLRNHVRMVS